MEETNCWLDPEEVKHINVKAPKPENKKQYFKNEKNEKNEKKEENIKKGDEKIENTENINMREINIKKGDEKKEKGEKGEEINVREIPIEEINISSIKKDDEKTKNFLETLLNELDYLPFESKEFAVKVFGPDWLKIFIERIKDLKQDIMNSKFFPSEDRMLLLKFIFLLQQAF